MIEYTVSGDLNGFGDWKSRVEDVLVFKLLSGAGFGALSSRERLISSVGIAACDDSIGSGDSSTWLFLFVFYIISYHSSKKLNFMVKFKSEWEL